jgi:hypothetical protein
MTDHTPGDLVIYRTRKHGTLPAVFIAYVGCKALIRIGGIERSVFLHSLEAV